MKSLRQIFDEQHTDKGTKHSYDKIYEPLFEPRRNDPINFLEIGIWKGHSMAALHEYFPNGNIYGADIFTRLNPEDVPILQEWRCAYVKGDTTKPEITGVLTNKFGVMFDYILDDGAHHPEANMLTFRHTVQFLKPGGYYIIEDVWPLELMGPRQLKHEWLLKNPEAYSHFKNEIFLRELEMSGMTITRFDNREISGQPDSYVIVLQKGT